MATADGQGLRGLGHTRMLGSVGVLTLSGCASDRLQVMGGSAGQMEDLLTYQHCQEDPSTCTQLQFYQAGLTSTIPTTIGLLTALTSLVLQFNALKVPHLSPSFPLAAVSLDSAPGEVVEPGCGQTATLCTHFTMTHCAPLLTHPLHP
jgi:hypothetical protein